MRLLIIFLIFSCVGCRHSKPAFIKNGQAVTDASELAGLAGTWYATPDTDSMLREKNYRPDSIYIELQKDSVLKAHHLPDCMTAANKGGLLQDALGVWKINKDGDHWRVSVAFEAGKLFRYKTYTFFEILKVNGALTLYQYIGNTDEGKVLRFTKH